MSTATPNADVLPIVVPYQPMRMTVADYHKLIADGTLTKNHRIELLRGVMTEKMTHNPLHAELVGILQDLLNAMTYGLYEALRLVLEEGLDNCFARHRKNHEALKAGLAAIGIRYSAQEGHILPQLNAVSVPEGVDDAKIRNALLNRFGIEIGAGLGAYKGKVWRIGLMGYGSRPVNVLMFLASLEQLLAEQDYLFEHGASIAAANDTYI